MEVPFKAYALPGCEALIPHRKSDEDSGFDLRSAIDAYLDPGHKMTVPCGFKMSVPKGFEGQVRPRSGLAAKHGITVLNSPGTIDSSYRGEVKVILVNHGSDPFVIKTGDRIAQLVISAVPPVDMQLVSDEAYLGQSDRGANGFGSSGVK
jgi:dUTP pyrophosphatase